MKDDEQTQSDEEYFNELDQLEAEAGSVLAVSDKLAQQFKRRMLELRHRRSARKKPKSDE